MDCRGKICSFVDRNLETYQKIALEIHSRPEVSNYEFFACKILSDRLAAEGFSVKTGVAGHRTGFDARCKSRKPGPVMVFLAEFDALPGIGHACGHNLFGPTSLLAAASLKQVLDELGGEIRVYGTPGEEGGENGSAKGSFVREGFFEDVDFALCVHPGSDRHLPTPESIGCAPVDIEFWGRPSHAASAPEKGINALDAVIQVYNSINAMRQHIPDDVRIHGIIVNGGSAPNIVPDYASAKFYIRAAKMPTLRKVYARVEQIVQGAALATGATGRMRPSQNIVENMVTTPLFDRVYAGNLEKFGEKMTEATESFGSSDIGNVSQVVPAIQPMIRISDNWFPGHSEEKKAACASETGLASIGLGAKVLACTAADLIENPQLLSRIKREHALRVAAQET